MAVFPWSGSGYQTLMNYYAIRKNNIVQKAEEQYGTSTAGAHDSIYGRGWAALYEMEYNNWNVAPKYDMTTTGFRVVTTRKNLTTANSNTIYGGVAEGGQVPEATNTPSEKVKILPKTVDRKVSMTDVQQVLAMRGMDDVGVDLEFARNWTAEEMLVAIGNMLSKNVQPPASPTAPYTGTSDFESWDRIVSCKAIADALDTHATNHSHYNVYTNAYNRRTSTNYDSYCVTAATNETFGGTNGNFTPELVEDVIYGIGSQSGYFPNVLVASWELQKKINRAYQGFVRTAGENTHMLTESKVEMGGGDGVITARPGTRAGFQASSILGIPLVNTSRSTGGTGEGRIYALSTRVDVANGRPLLGFARALPLTYGEIDVLKQPYLALIEGKHVSTGMFTIKGENICTRPNAQGLIRDIAV